MAKRKGTAVYARQHDHGLTLPQLSAVDLLVAGKTDTESAELLGLHRTTITKWRLYSPEFQATLNVRRAETWGAAAARLQALIPKAVNVLAEGLEQGLPEVRLKVAMDVLKLIGPPYLPTIGPTDPTEIVRERALHRRAQADRDAEEDDDFRIVDKLDGETVKESTVKVRAELDALANTPAPTLERLEGSPAPTLERLEG